VPRRFDRQGEPRGGERTYQRPGLVART
jgi:hypothetical protein